MGMWKQTAYLMVSDDDGAACVLVATSELP